MNHQPGDTVSLYAAGAPHGLVGTITVEVRNASTQVVLVAETSAGIVENVTGTTSDYVATVDLPEDAPVGAYRAYWDLHDGTDPVPDTDVFTIGLVVSWRPTSLDVAKLLVERTSRAFDDDAPSSGGDFTADTATTKVQAERLIDVAVTEIARAVRIPIRDEMLDAARELAALRAANLCELSRVPGGSADEDRSVAPQYIASYLSGLEDLVAAHPLWNSRLH